MRSRRTDANLLVEGYRQLLIQEKIHNSSYAGRILPLLDVLLVEILSGFAVVALFRKAKLFQISIFLIMYVDIFLVSMVILTSAASIHVKPKGWITTVKSRNVNGVW